MRGGLAFCCACNNCVLDSDDYNRADSASIGGKWSVVSGSPSIASNRLVFSAPGEITFLQEHVGLTARARVVVQTMPVTSSLIVELQIAKSSATDYLGVRFDFGACHTMQLFKCVGGVKTLVGNLVTISDRLDAAQMNTIEICWDPNLSRLRAKATPAEGTALMVEYTDTTFAQGLRSGIYCSSLAYFDNYSFEWMGAASDTLHGFCPKCSAGCVIDTDTFLIDNDCKWDFYGTRGTLLGGTLISSNETRLFRNTANTAQDPVSVSATIAINTISGNFELIIGAEDDTSYYFGRLLANTPTEWTLSLGDLATDVVFPVDPTADYVLDLCLEPAETVTSTTLSQEYTPDRVVSSTGWTDADFALLNDAQNALYGIGGAPPVTSDEIRLEFDRDPLLPAGKALVNIKVEFWAGHDGSSSNVTAEVSVNGTFDGVLYTLASGTARYEADGLWGLTSTSEINADLRAGLRFTDYDTGTAQITVNYMRVTIYYFDDDVVGGSLKLSIREYGTGGQLACVVATDVAALGTKAGFISDSAQWFVRDITYQYIQSDDRPECPSCRCDYPPRPCGMCIDYEAPPFFALTITGLTSFAAPGDCDLCPTLDGTYILEKWDGYPVFAGESGGERTEGVNNPNQEALGCGWDGGGICLWGAALYRDPVTGVISRIDPIQFPWVCGSMRIALAMWFAQGSVGDLYICLDINVVFCREDFVPHVAHYHRRIGPWDDASDGFDCLNFNNEIFPLSWYNGNLVLGCGCSPAPSVRLSTL